MHSVTSFSSFEGISECIELNKKNTSKEVNVSSRQLVWKKNQQMATELVDKFDFIVAADW